MWCKTEDSHLILTNPKLRAGVAGGLFTYVAKAVNINHAPDTPDTGYLCALLQPRKIFRRDRQSI